MYGVEWQVGDFIGDKDKIKSEFSVFGGGAPNCPSMVSQWICDKTNTTHVKIFRNTNH